LSTTTTTTGIKNGQPRNRRRNAIAAGAAYVGGPTILTWLASAATTTTRISKLRVASSKALTRDATAAEALIASTTTTRSAWQTITRQNRSSTATATNCKQGSKQTGRARFPRRAADTSNTSKTSCADVDHIAAFRLVQLPLQQASRAAATRATDPNNRASTAATTTASDDQVLKITTIKHHQLAGADFCKPVNAVDDAADFNVKNIVAAFSPGAAFFAQRNTLRNYQCHSAPPEVSFVQWGCHIAPLAKSFMYPAKALISHRLASRFRQFARNEMICTFSLVYPFELSIRSILGE
jgi:hypothetical protein